MSGKKARVPGWSEYLAKLKDAGIWQKPELRDQAIAEWDRLYGEQCARDEAPVIADLHAAGIMVTSLWDMVNARTSFAIAIPILLQHLRKSYPTRVREGLARAMAEPAAKFAWSELKEMYEREENWEVKDALAVALANSAGEDQFDDLVDLCLNKSNGHSRSLLLSALDRSKNPDAENVLQRLEMDEYISSSVREIMKKRARRKKR